MIDEEFPVFYESNTKELTPEQDYEYFKILVGEFVD